MTDVVAVRAAIESLLAMSSVVSALVATQDGDVVDVVPAPPDASEAAALAEWAAEQVEAMESIRNLVGEKEFSLLYDPKDGATRLHCHLQSVARHLLLILFRDRDCLGSVRKASKEAALHLERAVRP
jgi:hypothetical protein